MAVDISVDGKLSKAELRENMNSLGRKGTPFVFIVDFDQKESLLFPVDTIDPEYVLYDINGFSNKPEGIETVSGGKIELRKSPVSYKVYKEVFEKIHRSFIAGNTYLLNLTFPTPVRINMSLREIFYYSAAKYKLFYNNEFVVFSPEPFVRINDGIISSYPMKGTIDAGLPNAEKLILENEKELAEHITIVDLIRNDIGIVARDVRVEQFRYIERIETSEKVLLQVSSKITGRLPNDYSRKIGDIITSMLPAGSITGAPKKKTVEIIKKAEIYSRGYYTGIFGYFDGNRLDSGVMIRFIERQGEGFRYKSGGGLTIYSDPVSEYEELKDKVYIPPGTFRKKKCGPG